MRMWVWVMPRRAAHPRSRGEHCASATEVSPCLGSSPLARGTSEELAKADKLGRLIPARAGNIAAQNASKAGSPAHPRSRGEHVIGEATTTYEGGSSPLARGTLVSLRSRCLRGRLIPARAGNIDSYGDKVIKGAAHPRSRGEHLSFPAACGRRGGSSPLARGTSHAFRP